MVTYPVDSGMIHLFEVQGKRFALDVHNCIFLEIDKLMWDALQLVSVVHNRQELAQALSAQYHAQIAESLVDELDTLADHNLLFSPDLLKEQAPPFPNGIATLCVNVSQACNLRCRYCFAGDGTFGRPPALMSVETAKQTVDFFLRHSGKYKDLSLCFFGGEPLLNFNTIQQTVDYAEQQAKDFDKIFRFNITTNGTLLSAPVRRFLAAHRFGVIVSIDGSADVHDAMRPFVNGQGSYDTIRGHLDAFRKELRPNEVAWTLRATFSRYHLHFADQAFHLASLGFKDISVEPCASDDPDLGISWVNLPALKAQYTDFAKRYLEAIRAGQRFSFFHFRVMLEQTKRGTQRLMQCGAGLGYLAVSASGELYPCHRLVGQEQYEIGSVHEGIMHPERRELFASAHVNSKSLCRQCWARYICGGGCHACAIQFNGNISMPYELECELVRQRIELGAYIYSELSRDQQEQLSILYDRASANRPYISGA
jgi:uncharacterized protein